MKPQSDPDTKRYISFPKKPRNEGIKKQPNLGKADRYNNIILFKKCIIA